MWHYIDIIARGVICSLLGIKDKCFWCVFIVIVWSWLCQSPAETTSRSFTNLLFLLLLLFNYTLSSKGSRGLKTKV